MIEEVSVKKNKEGKVTEVTLRDSKDPNYTWKEKC